MCHENFIIGYTSGVFDMFHIGHLNILKRAKELCDFLIVGVSTDELVREYKHKSPIISYDNRKAIVEACKYVDKKCFQIFNASNIRLDISSNRATISNSFVLE